MNQCLLPRNVVKHNLKQSWSVKSICWRKSTVVLTSHAQCVEGSNGCSSCVALRNHLSVKVIEKRLQSAWEYKDLTLWKNVMWSDESRLILFQSNGCIRVWRQADGVMLLSCLVPTVGAVILSCISWSGLFSALLCYLRWADCLNFK